MLSCALCRRVVVCCAGGKGKAVSGSVIRATIPYVKADIPILVLFRALGTVVSVFDRHCKMHHVARGWQ
jgi:hypothetical protein